MSEKCLIDTYQEILENQEEFGSKIVRLAELKKSGYNIPFFVGLGRSLIENLIKCESIEDKIYLDIEKEIKEKINTKSYAVRSSAFIEDSKNYSHAGEFMTKLDVPIVDIRQAIYEVIIDAKNKISINKEENSFSIIIQEYIAPDFAGVIFTRNPLGKYEMVLEWNKGNGLRVVGGESSSRIVFPFNILPKKEAFICFYELIDIAKSIEKEKDFPQDIEWAVKGNKLYILQTRPITTLNNKQYQGFKFLDNINFPKDYFYDKSTLVESFNKPLPLVEELFRHIYKENGPISNAYKFLKIKYKHRDIFKKFGNELFINKEEELKQFFPTHSYFGSTKLIAHFANVRSVFTTIQNMYHFSSLMKVIKNISFHDVFLKHTKNFDILFEKNISLSSILEQIDLVYKDIFLVNIIAEKTYKDLDFVLRDTPYKTFELINVDFPFLENIYIEKALLTGLEDKLFGNSLNISDESVFVAKFRNDSVSDRNLKIKLWFEKLPKNKQNFLKNKIINARQYEVLREEGRWLSVMCVSLFRKSLKEKAKELGLDNDELVYFVSLSEIEKGILNNLELIKRKELYEIDNDYEFPNIISSISNLESNKPFGISPGIAQGKVFSLKEEVIEGGILFTETLDPSLVAYFDKISGIISLEGGMLSHLAIVAREYKIPIVVDSNASSYLVSGPIVSIDGSKGIISVISSK